MSLASLPSELVHRLRERAADAERRVDGAPSVFTASVQSMSISSMFEQLRELTGALGRVVQANRDGRVEPELLARADRIQRDMSTPAPMPDVTPATERAVVQAEAALGFALPAPLRQVYLEVGNGGFGPGGGIISAQAAAAAWRSLTDEPAGPADQPWPRYLLPFSDRNPGYDCIDIRNGRIVIWNPEEIEDDSDESWRRSFRDDAESLAAYFEAWLAARDPYAVAQEQAMAGMVEHARAARAHIASLSAAERAAMGLPEVGWEHVVWGGIGLDDPEGDARG
ncbi:MAG TPA: SMI1/KNR4 family protein [Candidatus Limnocylindrales bacterium]|nr:SMI1/KNR4 family protein [Candidatus Limnocylindrales bacterium]